MIIIFRRRESSPYEWSLLKCFARSSSVQPEKASFRQWKSLKFHPSLAVGVFAQLFVVNVCEWSRARLEKERGKKKRALEQELQILRQFLLSRGPQFAVRPGNYLFRWNIDVAWEFSEAISSLPIDRRNWRRNLNKRQACLSLRQLSGDCFCAPSELNAITINSALDSIQMSCFGGIVSALSTAFVPRWKIGNSRKITRERRSFIFRGFSNIKNKRKPTLILRIVFSLPKASFSLFRLFARPFLGTFRNAFALLLFHLVAFSLSVLVDKKILSSFVLAAFVFSRAESSGKTRWKPKSLW